MTGRRKYPAYLYVLPRHARRAALEIDLAERAVRDLAFHPSYRQMAGGDGAGHAVPKGQRIFWIELGRALDGIDAGTVAASCEILVDALHARRTTAGRAAKLVREWRLGRLGHHQD